LAERIIGIDLGTSNSAAAIIQGGKPTIIPAAEGQTAHGKAFPSVVAFPKDGSAMLVGTPAVNQAVTNPENTITKAKRQMGTDHVYKIEGKEYKPQQISAFILQKIKKDAEAFTGDKITKAVITVPAYFDDNQRQATKDAGTIAGLDALKAVKDELESVVLVTTKNPNSLKGAPFFDSSDIDPEKIFEPTILFDGTAKEAVSLFPKNVNVSALLSLVGLGGYNTSVRVVADPNTDKNTHEINANGKFGNIKITVENVPDSMNPKTSRLATLSAEELLRQICTKEVQIGT